jgi:hypothetical protein
MSFFFISASTTHHLTNHEPDSFCLCIQHKGCIMAMNLNRGSVPSTAAGRAAGLRIVLVEHLLLACHCWECYHLSSPEWYSYSKAQHLSQRWSRPRSLIVGANSKAALLGKKHGTRRDDTCGHSPLRVFPLNAPRRPGLWLCSLCTNSYCPGLLSTRLEIGGCTERTLLRWRRLNPEIKLF